MRYIKNVVSVVGITLFFEQKSPCSVLNKLTKFEFNL